jgi:hypothetical protein
MEAASDKINTLIRIDTVNNATDKSPIRLSEPSNSKEKGFFQLRLAAALYIFMLAGENGEAPLWRKRVAMLAAQQEALEDHEAKIEAKQVAPNAKQPTMVNEKKLVRYYLEEALDADIDQNKV